MTFIQIKLIFHFICLLIANINQVSGRLDSLLSRLFDQSHSAHRPLIVILDNTYINKKIQKPVLQEVNPLTSSDETAHIELPIISQKLTKRPRRLSTRPPMKPKFNKNKNRLSARDVLVQRSRIQSPIVKSLLRISNDLNCDAKDECEDECKDKFKGNKKVKCVVTCKKIYECILEESKETCKDDECDVNSCESRDCEEKTGSTKGYKMSNEKQWCNTGRC